MSSARSVSATTSLPKPGALAPAEFGRSSAATDAASADLSLALALARAAAGWGGDIGAFLDFPVLVLRVVAEIEPDQGSWRKRASNLIPAYPSAGFMPTLR